MTGKAKLDTPEKALTEAIVAAVSQPGSVQVTEARFGRYSESVKDFGGTWHWRLACTTEISNDGQAEGDDLSARVGKVVSSWAEAIARYGKPEGEQK